MVRDSFVKALHFFFSAKDCDRTVPPKAGKNLRKIGMFW